VYKVLWLQPKKGLAEYANNSNWISDPLCPIMIQVQETDRTKSRTKRQRQERSGLQEPWLSLVGPSTLFTSCTAKFRSAKDISRMNFCFPNADMGHFFLETIAKVVAGAALSEELLRPEAEENDENRPDLDDDDDVDEDFEEVFEA